jgi:fucose permease
MLSVVWVQAALLLSQLFNDRRAMLVYSVAPSYLWIMVFTIPFGLGAGAVDTGLNNYVAKHYSSRHMNWLHCFWGFGASMAPLL